MVLGERFRGRWKEPISRFQGTAIGIALLHFFLYSASLGLSDPKAEIYSPKLHPAAVRRVLEFPIITMHDAIFGQLRPGEPGWTPINVRFWFLGNSMFWGFGTGFVGRAALRRIRSKRERIWSQSRDAA